MSRHRISTALLLLALPGWLGAQEEKQPKATFGGLVEVSEVFLDVVATDRHGELVLGLGPEDFIVEENGEPVPIRSVSFYSTRYGADGAPLGDDDVPSSRYFLFFLHDQSRTGFLGNALVRRVFDAGRQAERWVMEEMLPSDWVAVTSYDVKLKLHQDFTQDRAAISQALANAVRGKNVPEVKPSERRPPLPGVPSLARHLPEGRQLMRQTTDVHDALRLLAEAAGYVVGRKNLLLFTLGFGREDGNFRISRPDPRYYPDLVAALNDHNVAVYPIDLMPDGLEPRQPDFLNQIASDTGGEYFETFVSFLTPIERVSEENVGYYLLSYQTEHPAGEVGYQRVTVRARQEGIEVRSRQGYVYGK